MTAAFGQPSHLHARTGGAPHPLRVGVIGAGIMGADHARTLHHQVNGATVAAVTDVDGSRAAALAADLAGSRVASNSTALIGDHGVDAVVIASHDYTHADLTLAAVAAGKPVLVEKPLAPTVAECRRVTDTEASRTDLIAVGFMRRFDPGYRRLRAAVSAGDVGAALVLHCVSRGVTSGAGATDESSVLGSTIHDLDVVPWLLGAPIVEVSWHSGRSTAAAGFRDPQVMLLRTADGALTTVETFLNAGYGYDIRCEIVGETGVLSLREPATVTLDAALARSVGYAADWRPRFAEAYRVELQAWVDRVRGVHNPRAGDLATAADGLAATAVGEAVIVSMRDRGAWVAVARVAPGELA